MSIKDTPGWKTINKRLDQLVRKMGNDIPHTPPLSCKSLENMKQNNPEGYKLHSEFQELNRLEDKMLEEDRLKTGGTGNDWRDLNNEIWIIKIKMNNEGVQYNPPLEGRHLANMKQHNKRGYDLLMEYQRLIALEEELGR